MNFAKPGWVAWGNCSKCGKRFDTRRHTRALCPECNRVISPRITRRESLELELWNYLHLFDNVEYEVRDGEKSYSSFMKALRLVPFLYHIMLTNLNYSSILSEYSYYYPYC